MTRLLVELAKSISNDAEHLSVEVPVVGAGIKSFTANDFVEEPLRLDGMFRNKAPSLFRWQTEPELDAQAIEERQNRRISPDQVFSGSLDGAKRPDDRQEPRSA